MTNDPRTFGRWFPSDTGAYGVTLNDPTEADKINPDTIYEAIKRVQEAGVPIPRYIVLHPTAWRSLLHARARIEARSHKRALRKRQTIRQRIQAIARRKQGRVAA